MTKFLVVRLFKFIKVDRAFFLLFQHLFTMTPYLIKQVGVIQMCYTISTLYSYARRGLTLNPLLVIEAINSRIPNIVIRDLITIILPYWNQAMKLNPSLLKNIFNIYLFSFSIGLIKPLLRWLFKYSLGFIFTSLGVAWNEVLSSITLLKQISDYILSIVPIMPALHHIHTALLDSLPGDTFVTRVRGPATLPGANSEVSPYQSADLFTLIGLVLLGAGGLYSLFLPLFPT